MKIWGTRTVRRNEKGPFSLGPGPGALGGPRRRRTTVTTQTVCAVQVGQWPAGGCSPRGRAGGHTGRPPDRVGLGPTEKGEAAPPRLSLK